MVAALDRVGWVLTLAGVILVCQTMGYKVIDELSEKKKK